MATRTITQHVCDFMDKGKVCGADAAAPGLNATIAAEKVKGDLCTKHETRMVQELTRMGMRSLGMKTPNRKVTKGYRGASNRKFSATEARTWAIAEGLIEKSRTGRIPKEILDKYAAAH